MTGTLDAKTVAASRTRTTEIVLPNDTNPNGTMFGGRLLSIMDKCAGICAWRHAGRVSVTAGIDSVEFHKPLQLGAVILVEARITRTFRTSMEIEVIVSLEDPNRHQSEEANRAYFTFVALDQEGRPTPVPPLRPKTPEEEERYRKAGLRREVRLYLSGRLELKDATQVVDALLVTLQTRDL